MIEGNLVILISKSIVWIKNINGSIWVNIKKKWFMIETDQMPIYNPNCHHLSNVLFMIFMSFIAFPKLYIYAEKRKGFVFVE